MFADRLLVNVHVVETDVVECGPVVVVFFVKGRGDSIDHLVLAMLLDPRLDHLPFVGFDELL